MKQFRKKPVIIEAIQWNSSENINKAIEWLGDKLISEGREGIGAVGYWIKTLEGDMMISFGDWIIKGVNGEFYPCKPDIFEKNYEDADIQQPAGIQSLIERVEDELWPNPGAAMGQFNEGLRKAISILKSTPVIKAKALRKKGTDEWYVWNNYIGYFERVEVPIPLFGRTKDLTHPKDSELVDIEILQP